ncbi:hypothetical protein [Chryseobacterium sp. SIMBA_038]|uniref:hypothetical protein n=1 Tax=Chryseobacterium sp. SIMBA_038 TaxID=3085780 RepID=UPI003978D594
MNKTLNKLQELQAIPLPILTDKEAEHNFVQWSYVNIYSLQDLKDIYLISNMVEEKSVKHITKKVNELIYSKTKWEERKVLEYLNALVKFELLDAGYAAHKKFFIGSDINQELTIEDIAILRNVFFYYFRFKELSSWFISPTQKTHSLFDRFTSTDYLNLTKPLYFCSERNRFTDTFFEDINNISSKYIIESDILMRFWDVYLKWGTTLNILDKFNISKTGEKNIFENKEVSIAYFVRPFEKFDLIEFVQQNFNSRQIWIPELIHKIVRKYRYAVSDVKDFIVSEVLNNSKLTYERTSEIFLIKGKTSKKNIESATYLFPKVNNAYISHIILRR